MGLLDSVLGLLSGGQSDESTSADRRENAATSEGSDRLGSAGNGRDQVIDDRSEFGDADHVPPGCLVGDSVDDLEEMAEDYADSWAEFGPTDYSVESIRGVDEMFATQQDRANWLTIDLDDGRTGSFAPMAAQPACYFGAVMIRHYDAEWVLDRDYGWALGFKGETIVNLFGTVHGALDGDPPFVRLHDTFVANYDLDGEFLDPDGERLEERRQDSGVDPDDIDDEELEGDAQQSAPGPAEMAGFADDFAGRHSGYDLDYSIDSLSAVDAVFDDKFRSEEFADAELGGTDDEASIVLTAAASEAGAYFGEVLTRNTDAEWNRRDDGLKIEFPTAEADVRVDPIATASSVIDDGDSFAASFDDLRETVDAIETELTESDA
ncbi:hypothetical protein [Halomicrobium salinisoli]|uniref:hypothetical protein n=1 Tax=Halomicrobium salinisoli TaxID=2878391 RepID=UPI001CEFFE07|nr:hypothetical protein [Halomicrobium salinisoli]